MPHTFYGYKLSMHFCIKFGKAKAWIQSCFSSITSCIDKDRGKQSKHIINVLEWMNKQDKIIIFCLKVD